MNTLYISGDCYLVGDVHGRLITLMSSLQQRSINSSSIIILGDVGLGFAGNDEEKLRHCDSLLEQSNNRLYLIRGNHDKPQLWQEGAWTQQFQRIHFIADGQQLLINEKLYVAYGGAISIDRCKRKQGIDYWVEEPFSPPIAAIEGLYGVLAHTGPFSQGWGGIMNYILCDQRLRDDLAQEEDNILATIDLLHPVRWYCGHFHQSQSLQISSTSCRCLNIDEILLMG